MNSLPLSTSHSRSHSRPSRDTLSAVKPEIRARQSWMAPKHSLGLFRLRATPTSTSTSSLRRQRRLAGCAGAQFADSASVVVEDAPCRQHLLQSSGKSAVAAKRRQSSIDSADSRQLQMVCDRDRDRDTKAVRVALQLQLRCVLLLLLLNESVSCD